MHLSAAQRLFLTYVLLTALLTIGMSWGLQSLVRRTLITNLETDLRRELALGRGLFDEIAAGLPADSVARILGRLSGRRVTIVDRNGALSGETAIIDDGLRLEDYRTRREIQGALDRGGMSDPTVRGGRLFIATVTATGDVLRFSTPLDQVDQVVDGVRRSIFAVVVGTLLASLVFAFGFTVTVTRPLRRIGETARALAAGDLSRRVRMEREDELGDLGNALNTLGEELQRRLGQLEGERAEMQALIDSMSEGVLALSPNGEIRRANPAARRMFALGSRVTGIAPEMVSRRPDFLHLVDTALDGRTAPPAELVVAGVSLLAAAHPLPNGGAVLVFLDISELRRLEGVRRDFVANASHELKTPLTAIRGYVETLADPGLPPELVKRFTDIVRANVERLQRIVDDLLDLSRIEAGGWRVEPTSVPIEPIAREVWGMQRIEGKQIELHLDVPPEHATVWGDPAATRQILTNLFSNAVRYTPDGGRITVRSRPAVPAGRRRRDSENGSVLLEGWTTIEVEDNGSGIPSAHLSRVFERFYRVDPARSREEGGTGLGLAIVKHLVELHGGWVEADSQVGKGTIMRFTMPSEPMAIRPPSARATIAQGQARTREAGGG